MSDLKTYPEGTPFTGRIGRTASASEPAWPIAKRRPRRRAERHGVPARRRRLRPARLLSAPTSARRLSTGSLPSGLRYRDFHTTAICSPTRACLLTGRNHHTNGVGIIQEMATGYPGYNGTVPQRERLPVGDAARRRLRHVRHRQVAPDAGRANTRPVPRRRAGRCRAASSASTASSAARRASGRRRWCTTTTTSRRRVVRRTAITSTPIWPIARSNT